MAEFPSMPLWTDAYLADTTHLTTIEHGAFVLLLMTMWRAKGNRLPDDDRLLAKYTRLSLAQWKRIRPTMEALNRVENGIWTNGRLLDEVEAVRRHVQQRSDAGRASALKRKNRGSTVVPTGGQREANTHTHTHEKEKEKKEKVEFVFPVWIAPEAGLGWLDFRRQNRWKVTERVFALLLRDLESLRDEGIDPNAALDHCVARGWRGFKADWIRRDMVKPAGKSAVDADRLKSWGIKDLEDNGGNTQRGGNHSQAARGNGEDDMPPMLTHQAEEGGPVSVGDVQAGRDSLALLAL